MNTNLSQHVRSCFRACGLFACVLATPLVAIETALADILTTFDFAITPQQVIEGRAAPQYTLGLGQLRFEAEHVEASFELPGFHAEQVALYSGSAARVGSHIADFDAADSGRWTLSQNLTVPDNDFLHFIENGIYVRIEGESGVLRGQVLTSNWNLQVLRLTAAPLIPQFPQKDQAVAAILLDQDTGVIRVRLSANTDHPAMKADIHALRVDGSERHVMQLEQSAHERDLWGSADINDRCTSQKLSEEALLSLNSGQLFVRITPVHTSAAALVARLLPPTQLSKLAATTIGANR